MNSQLDYAPVLFLFGTLEIGGSETKFVRLANRLRALGLPVHIAYLRPPAPLLEQIDAVPTINLEQSGKWSRRAYRNLSSYIRAHSIRSVINVNLYPLAYSTPLAGFRKGSEINNIASINTSEVRAGRDRAFMFLYARLLRCADKLVFGSSIQMDQWITGFKLPRQRSVVLYNGVDGQFFSPQAIATSRAEMREELGVPSGAHLIVSVSQFRPEKGHKNLLQAVGLLEKRHNRKPYVLLVGDGTERQAIVDCAAELQLDNRVIFSGAVQDVRPYLQASDLFVLPSTAVETFSNAALEAAAMGIPAVLSDLGGAREMFPEGSTGVIFERNSVDELADILADRVSGGQLTDEMKDVVRQEVLARFDINSMTKKWISTIWPQSNPESVVS